MIAKINAQSYEIDYKEIIGPVVKMNTVHILISLAANLRWCIQLYDAKNFFLYADVEKKSIWLHYLNSLVFSKRTKFANLKKGSI